MQTRRPRGELAVGSARRGGWGELQRHEVCRARICVGELGKNLLCLGPEDLDGAAGAAVAFLLRPRSERQKL